MEITLGALAGSLGGSVMGSLADFIPYFSQLQVFAQAKYNALWPTKPPDVNTVMSVYAKEPLQRPKAVDAMKLLGYSENATDWYAKALQDVMPYSTAYVAYQRGLLPSSGKYSLSYIQQQNSIDDDLAKIYNKLYQWYPTVSELDRWYITGAYDDEIARTYTLDADIESAYIEGMGKGLEPYLKLGMNEKFARYEWRATWQMPSFYEATYMLNWYLGNKAHPEETEGGKIHFNRDDFAYAMKVANWPPFFQKLLEKIASHAPTRNMIEQFYQAEIISEKELPEMFDWAGYHGRINDLLVKYTVMMYAPSHKKGIKNATASLLQKLYTGGKITEEKFRNYMKDLGYTESAIDLYEAYIQLNEQMEYEKNVTAFVEEAFKKNEISETEAFNTLTSAGISNMIASLNINKWKSTKIKSRKYLSITDLAALYMSKIMNRDQVYKYLLDLGYDETDAGRILLLNGIK